MVSDCLEYIYIYIYICEVHFCLKYWVVFNSSSISRNTSLDSLSSKYLFKCLIRKMLVWPTYRDLGWNVLKAFFITFIVIKWNSDKPVLMTHVFWQLRDTPTINSPKLMILLYNEEWKSKSSSITSRWLLITFRWWLYEQLLNHFSFRNFKSIYKPSISKKSIFVRFDEISSLT